MRVDEKTKEVLQEWPLTTVKRWAASPKSFTLVRMARHRGDQQAPGQYWRAACGYGWSSRASIEGEGGAVYEHRGHWSRSKGLSSMGCSVYHFSSCSIQVLLEFIGCKVMLTRRPLTRVLLMISLVYPQRNLLTVRLTCESSSELCYCAEEPRLPRKNTDCGQMLYRQQKAGVILKLYVTSQLRDLVQMTSSL